MLEAFDSGSIILIIVLTGAEWNCVSVSDERDKVVRNFKFFEIFKDLLRWTWRIPKI